MTLILLLAYLGGILTILSPCILPLLPFVFSGILGAAVYHVSMSVLDLALSTQVFASDLELLRAGWERSLSPVAVLQTVGLATPMVVGGCVGHWIGRHQCR